MRRFALTWQIISHSVVEIRDCWPWIFRCLIWSLAVCLPQPSAASLLLPAVSTQFHPSSISSISSAHECYQSSKVLQESLNDLTRVVKTPWRNVFRGCCSWHLSPRLCYSHLLVLKWRISVSVETSDVACKWSFVRQEQEVVNHCLL